MAIIRVKEIKAMSKDEMQNKLRELRQELINQRAKMSTGAPPESPGKFNQIKKTISRIKTIATEKGYKIA